MDRIAKECRQAMANAIDYDTWRDAAAALDRRDGLDDWKADETSELYDWRLIRSRLRQLRDLQAQGDIPRLIHHLRQGLHWNLGNIGNPELYSRSSVGTKHLIQDYVSEVVAALNYLCDHDFEDLGFGEKLAFFNETALSYGRSSLMLSGGATLGLFHVGVLKALYRQDLVPSVLSGSSAGSVVAATAGSRAPDELESLLDPENAYYHFWRPLKPRDMLTTGALMDPDQLRKAIAANVKDLTFEESFHLSGKVINITVSPAASNQPPRLLNYLTFPYLMVREATLASCSVPFLFPPVTLMTRDETGERVPFMPLLKWNDGSLKSDLPVLRMRRLHNVNHFVASQTNPHVIPFLSNRAPDGGGFLHSVRHLAGSALRSEARNLIQFARSNLPEGGARSQLENLTSILDQDYRGHVTVMPDRSLWRFARVTSNPNMADIRRFILEGERATWKRMSMIRNQVAIGQTLEACVDRLDRRKQDYSDRRDRPRLPELKLVRSESA